MTLVFKYKKIERPAPYQSTNAPAIPVTFIGPQARVEVIGLLDSGADFSFIPKDLANVLGLKETNQSEDIGGISGNIKARKSRLIVSIGKGRERYTFPMYVYVAEEQTANDFPILIGREGFFEKFKVTFAEAERKIYIKYFSKQRF